MAKSPLTYTGALSLLGQHERPLLDKIDKLLGGVILAATPFAGPAVWALIEPKNEAIGIIRSLLDSAKKRALHKSGHTRRELITAAHTILVVSSFFEALQSTLGSGYRLLELTDAEKVRLSATGEDLGRAGVAIDVNIPLPSAGRYFGDNLIRLYTRFQTLGSDTISFISGLAVGDQVLRDVDKSTLIPTLADRAAELYQDAYFRFAVDVPEFAIWVAWNDNAALQSSQTEIKYLVAGQSTALSKLHDLLLRTAPNWQPVGDSYRELLASHARAVLTKSLLRTEAERPSGMLAFPTVEQGFVTPHFKTAKYDKNAQPTQEQWWREKGRWTDLDEFLAAHLSSPDSTKLPLLILGHPGAGKSLLTEVLAARLPTSAFTVVRVPLRNVDPTQLLHQQITAAMERILHQEADWGEFTRECHDTIRVVILDGFDELIMATGVTQSAYLEQVTNFQQDELDLGRPVAVIVTSRTLVANRARIPDGCLIVKLEEFNDDQIDRWLDSWNTANASTTDFRPLEPEELREHDELARQPLVLLILAIYAAESGVRLNSEDLSGAGLYQRMLDSFIRRQVREKTPVTLSDHEAAEREEYKRWQLSIAAFGMFNRGLQHITESDLELDIAAFQPETARDRVTFDQQVTRAEQTISDFFFVQTSRAEDRRTYEFLHATFGEYLIAECTMNYLARMPLPSTFPVRKTPDDDELFALLSHQPVLKRAPIVDFADELVRDQRQHVLGLLTELLRQARSRKQARQFELYAPTQYDTVCRLAAYTANLAALRILLDDEDVSPRTLAPPGTDPMQWWRSMVNLWESGLDVEGWNDVLNTFTLTYGPEPIFTSASGRRARLLHNDADELSALAGEQLLGAKISIENEAEKELFLNLVRVCLPSIGPFPLTRLLPDLEERFESIAAAIAGGNRLSGNVSNALWRALAHAAAYLPFTTVSTLVSLLLNGRESRYGQRWSLLGCELAAVVAAHPNLLLTNDDVATIAKDPGFPRSTSDEPLAVALLWATEQASQEPELSALRALRLKFDEIAASNRMVASEWIVPEYLTYLRTEQPPYWRIDDSVLDVIASQESILRRLAPRDALYLVTAYQSDSESDEHAVRWFVSGYLRTHAQSIDDLDEVNAIERLAEYAELPWTRP